MAFEKLVKQSVELNREPRDRPTDIISSLLKQRSEAVTAEK